ncbi:MAG TPA: phosphatidate cytidylyltransferase, partial [Tenericutes bacterium]|nr:phosphatidate cytidylyltransferase [Mycoplasmatota bacterium]
IQLDFVEIFFYTILLSLLGQLGDLVFSSIKRRYKIKDFGNIIPGHGGVLDRLDNILFVVAGIMIILS